MRIKQVFTFIIAMSFFVGTAYAEMTERRPATFHNKVTLKDKVIIEEDVAYGTKADVTSTKDMYPRNWIANSELGIWSGGSTWATGGINGLPDGWYIPSTSTFTGATLVAVTAIAPVSSVTPPFNHSMLLSTWGTDTGQTAVTKFVLYPEGGVSTASTWYKRFAGKNVTFGALVNRSIGQPVASGVTTNFVRPVINTYATHLSGVTSAYWKQGDYVEEGGWKLSTVSWDVPADINAFEVGFAMNPTILSSSASVSITGDSIYVVAPFLLINPLHKKYVSVPQEVIMFERQLDPFGSGGSNFTGTGLTTIDLSADNGWGGIVPDDVKEIYATVMVNAGSSAALQFYGDNGLGGVSIFGQISGVSPLQTTIMIPVSGSGTINVNNTAGGTFSGTSLFVHGVVMK